ncbi:MAG: cytochrome C, partial [Methylomicrobium sp.]|nr:cytochrome C [Methylomicrobium sp.]
MNLKLIKAILLLPSVLAFAIPTASADEFTDADLERWQQQFMGVVQQGRDLWTSPELGTNGVACAQ